MTRTVTVLPLKPHSPYSLNVLLDIDAELDHLTVRRIQEFAELYSRKIAKAYLNLTYHFHPDHPPTLRFTVRRDEYDPKNLRLSVDIDQSLEGWEPRTLATRVINSRPKLTAKRIWDFLFILLSEIPPSNW